jgi:hypothetical protein
MTLDWLNNSSPRLIARLISSATEVYKPHSKALAQAELQAFPARENAHRTFIRLSQRASRSNGNLD